MLHPRHWPYRLRLRLRALADRKSVERDLHDEMEFHLAMQAAENGGRGMAPGEAQMAARRVFGGVAQQQEACRDQIFGSLESWMRDVRYAMRSLVRAPGFTLTVLVTLALGIGGCTAVFCAMDRLLLRSLPYRDADRLVALHETQTGKGFRNVSLPNLLDWRSASHAFDGMAGFMTRTYGLRGGHGSSAGAVAVINVGMVTSDLFPVLRASFEAGRGFTEREEVEGRPLVVLTEGLWAREFGRAAGVVGSTVRLNDEVYEVIGVLHSGFAFPDPAVSVDAYIPLDLRGFHSRDGRPLQAVARLKAGAGFGGARTELQAIGARLAQAYPEENAHGGASLETLDDAWKGSRRRPLIVLTAAAFLLLGIVCTNVVNLMLSRSLARRREVSIRLALGAGLSAIVRQMLAEALLLSIVATALGLLLAHWALEGLPGVLRFAGATLPTGGLAVDSTTLGFSTALCLSVTLLCGATPALFARTLRLSAAINGGGDAGAKRGAFRLRRFLVAGQVALSLVLLLGAGAFLRVFVKLINRDPGFQSAQVYYFGYGLPDARYSDRQSVEFHDKLRERLNQIPGVEAVGAAYRLPLNGRTHTTSFQFEGAGLPRSQWSWVAYNIIEPAYFSALRIPLSAGRSFSWETDRPGRPLAVVVNRTFERLYGQDGRLLGKRIQMRFWSDLAAKDAPWEIVGVVADTYQTSLDTNIRPQVYLAVSQTGLDGGSYLIRSKRSDPGLPASVAAAVRAVDPNLERIELKPLDRWVSESLGNRRLPAVLTGLFAGVGLLLTALGIYGTVTLEIGQRRREIAIRLALGAGQGQIARLVLARGLLLSSVGAAIGLVAFVPVGKLLEAQLYETMPVEPANTAAVVAILFAFAAAACVRPAWEALRMRPLSILREI